MKGSVVFGKPLRRFRHVCAVFCTALLLFTSGCPNAADSGGSADATDGASGGGDTGTADAGAAPSEIVSLSSGLAIEVSERDGPVSVLYHVSATGGTVVSSFYEPVDPITWEPIEGGTRTTIAAALPAGDGQFRFDPSLVGAGYYRLGLTIFDGSSQQTILSRGVLHVQAPPNPVFLFPAEDITVRLGDDITIRFDLGDPEDVNVHWRAFYLSEQDSRTGDADELGTRLGTPGTGNVGQRVFATANLAPGDYQIGVSAVDTGDSVAAAVEHGDANRIVTLLGPTISVVEVAARPAEVKVVAPGATAVELFGGKEYQIQVEAAVYEPGAVGIVEVFYDFDDDFNRGFAGVIDTASITFSPDGLPTILSFDLPTTLPENTYYIGATISDGINPLAVDYASSTITIVRTPTLVVSAPDLSLPIPAADPDDASSGVRVEWTTNVPASSAKVDVFARALNSAGEPVSAELPIASYSSTAITSAVFFPETSGVFEVSVRIRLNEPTPDVEALDWCVNGACIKTAPKPVRVTTLPPLLWVGSLAQSDPSFDGAIFQGINEEDNSGSSLSSAGDLDNDGLQDFVIAARYGRSFLDEPTQVIGPGEAYIVYGASGASKLVGVHQLAFVGTSVLRGVLVTGVRTAQNSVDTDGLSSVSIIPDVDGDEHGELAFGFPRASSTCASAGPLCVAGQFLNGGVVIVSSDNAILKDPTVGSPTIDAGAVGQVFADMSPNLLEVDDRRAFPTDDPAATECIEETDNVADTIIGPAVGFIDLLANPDRREFTEISAGTQVSDGVCVTTYDVPTCLDTLGGVVLGGTIVGSGFYGTDTALDPKGARIIGPVSDSGFGTSIASFAASRGSPRGQVVVTAPERKGLASEVDGLSSDISGAGVAFLAPNRNLWGEDSEFGGTPPTPHQYVMGVSSHCGPGRSPPLDPLRIVGQSGEKINNVVAVNDFNGDRVDDLAVGVPSQDGGNGRVYLVFLRESGGDYVLGNLDLDSGHPDRLDGAMIVGGPAAGLGASMASGVDFNGDGVSDLVIGSPNADNGRGEVIIVFGDPTLQSPPGGVTVDSLLVIRNTEGRVRAARITGDTTTTEPAWFGYNVANAGDVDGDGFDDLLVAAPNATPRFDSDPTDSVDVLNALGVDTDFDGRQDDVSGPQGVADGVVDSYDDLTNAGLVYVIFGGTRLDQVSAGDRGERSIAVDELGTAALRGLVLAGRSAGDRLGGGDAGDVARGGHSSKNGRGRSQGLASVGDVDGDGRADILVSSVLADRHVASAPDNPLTNAGESYLIYSTSLAR